MSSQRIGVEQHQVGELSFFDRAYLIVHLQEFCRIQGRGLQGLQGSEAGGDESLQLVVQAEAGEDVDAGGRVGAGEELDAGAVHRVHDFEFFFDEVFARGEVVGVEVVHDFFGESLPRYIFPVGGGIFRAGIVSEVGLVDQVAATLPDQRGALPGVILRQQGEQRGRPRRIVGRKKLGLGLRPFQKFVFERRAAFEDSDQVLDALLARHSRLRRRGPHRARGRRT